MIQVANFFFLQNTIEGGPNPYFLINPAIPRDLVSHPRRSKQLGAQTAIRSKLTGAIWQADCNTRAPSNYQRNLVERGPKAGT